MTPGYRPTQDAFRETLAQQQQDNSAQQQGAPGRRGFGGMGGGFRGGTGGFDFGGPRAPADQPAERTDRNWKENSFGWNAADFAGDWLTIRASAHPTVSYPVSVPLLVVCPV